MKDNDSQLIFEAYVEENLTGFEKKKLHQAGMMPEVAAMEYIHYEEDLENITGVATDNSWYEHGGYDELGDPDDNLEDEQIATILIIGDDSAKVLFVDLADVEYGAGIYRGLHGSSFTTSATEMSTRELEQITQDVLKDSDIIASLKSMAMDADLPAKDTDEEHYKRGVSPGDFK